MKFDMHCHTKEGSIDGRVSIKDYARRLKRLGFDGMLVTDHNSYAAYRYYAKHQLDEDFRDFTVLKGIEYDTCDGGHIIVIMPEGTVLPLLEIRGLPVRFLIEIVHLFGGILGPAHPLGEKYLSVTNCKYYKKHPEVIEQFDFMETYNSCITEEANAAADELAKKYDLPGTGGSDSHKFDCIGLAYTEFSKPVTSQNELIKRIRRNEIVSCGGNHYPGTTRDHLGMKYDMLLRLYWCYSKGMNFFRRRKRRHTLKALEMVLKTTFKG